MKLLTFFLIHESLVSARALTGQMEVMAPWPWDTGYRSGFRVSPTHFTLQKQTSGSHLIPRLVGWTELWGQGRGGGGEHRPSSTCAWQLPPHCASVLVSSSLRRGTWPFSSLRSLFLTLLVKVRSQKAELLDVRSSVGRDRLVSPVKAQLSASHAGLWA